MRKEIEVIYVIEPVSSNELFRYVKQECFVKNEINLIATKYELDKTCKL